MNVCLYIRTHTLRVCCIYIRRGFVLLVQSNRQCESQGYAGQVTLKPAFFYMKNRSTFFLLLFTCTLLSACTCGNKKGNTGDGPRPVEVSRKLFWNADSLRYYAKKAYLEEDAHALFITGAAAYMQRYSELPDSMPTVSLDEGAIMLLRAAELGNEDAATLIHCLAHEGLWHHSVPEK